MTGSVQDHAGPLTVLIDQDHVQDFLIELENSPDVDSGHGLRVGTSRARAWPSPRREPAAMVAMGR